MNRKREILQDRIQIGAVALRGISRRKGFEVHRVNSMKPALMSPMIPSTRLEKVIGSWR